ncbi:MAG TPA: alpha-amylase family glycosyl hydrolase, partial [Bacilli bacterium]|nr:alpha-amylase family glycosyl hydrolase [Bacilli bacterium]
SLLMKNILIFLMKIFSKKMPDLNWENPKVQEEMVQMATWWCEQGIDGFRIDAISHLAKAEFVDSDLFPDHEYKPDWSKYSNLPRLHDYLKLLNKRVFSKYNIVTIGEVGGNAPVSEGIAYTNPKNHELNMVFNFDHNWCNNAWGAQSKKELSTDVQQLKAVFHKWQTGLYGQGWNAIYWLNHDQPRLMSQYGDPEHYHQESAKMLETVLYFMGGTPFIYNGEEIGMTNPEFKSIADFRDVSIINQYEINVKRHHQDEQAFLARAALTSRDNARSLMQWSDQADGGFSLVKPWNIIGDYHKINVAKQINDPQSIFTYYRRIIALRKSDQYRDVLVYGTYEGLWMEHPDLFAYMRSYAHQRLLVIANMTKKTVALPSIPYQQVKIILANYEGRQLSPALLPYEAMLIQIEEED